MHTSRVLPVFIYILDSKLRAGGRRACVSLKRECKCSFSVLQKSTFDSKIFYLIYLRYVLFLFPFTHSILLLANFTGLTTNLDINFISVENYTCTHSFAIADTIARSHPHLPTVLLYSMFAFCRIIRHDMCV